MALQIITGGSGCGKSKYVCDWVLAESDKNPKKNYFVIVPDQFTMQTQMDFVSASSKGGIMNIDIVSFSRLAYRIFEETGGYRRHVLDDTGKSLILRKLAGGIKEQVPVIGGNLNKQGYIHEVKSAISEFMQYGIGEAELDEMIAFTKSRGALHYKLKDLQVLYQAFREYIKDNYITTEESMDILAQELYKSERILGSVVVFDGFTGFTPIQEKVIGVLMKLCEQVIITVTMDGAELCSMQNAADRQGDTKIHAAADRQDTVYAQNEVNGAVQTEEHLFSFAEKTVRRLIKLANDYRTEVLPIRNLTENWRFRGKPQLLHLEQYLFRYPMIPYADLTSGADRSFYSEEASCTDRTSGAYRSFCAEGESCTDRTSCADASIYAEGEFCTDKISSTEKASCGNVSGKRNACIRISSHKDMQEEVRFLCRQIRKLLNESGCAYRDIAVIAGDLGAYESEMEEEFVRYEIPFFMDKTRNILLNPFIEYIRSALSILTQNFSYESVFHYLRSGLTDFTQEEIDDLENYVLEMGIRGRYAWSHVFVGRTLAMKKLDAAAEAKTKADGADEASAKAKAADEENFHKELTTAELLHYLNGLRQRLLEQLTPILAKDRTQMEDRVQGKDRTQIASQLQEKDRTQMEGQLQGKDKPWTESQPQAISPMHSIQVQNMVMRLYHFITQNQIEQKLHAYAAFFEAQKDDARAKEYQQIYRLIMELFDQIIELIGQETMSIHEFSDILDAGFAEIEVGIIPRSVDRIIVGDIERTRLKPVKYLFFVGVNDGYIPAKANKGGIISDIDREFLKGSNQELAPSPRERMYIQKYYLYLNMTKPSEGLFLSYSAMDGQGAALRPSYLIGVMKKLFPGCEMDKNASKRHLRIGNVLEAKEAFCLLLRKYAEGTISAGERKQFMKLSALLGKEEADRLLIEHWIENAYKVKTDSSISQAAAGLLYGDTILSSISRMEKYASCAYSYFLQYGLSLKERELYGFETKDMGTIFHGVLEHFSKKLLEKQYTWMDYPEEEGKEMVAASMEEVCMEYTNALLYDNALNRYTMKKMEGILQKCVSNISYQLKKGRFVPKEYEVSFHVIENLRELDLSLSAEDKMRLVGRIDRMDTYETEDKVFVKIVDYKSGDKSFDLAAFYHGTQLQLVVYMNEALKRTEALHPGKQPVSAAMLYYHVDDPVVEGTSGMSKEMIEGKVREALRMKGIINADGEILEALDTSKVTKSDCVPLDYDSKGGLKASTNAYTGEQMKLLSDYAGYSLKAMGVKIKKGEIPLNPYISGNMDSCTYCAYKDVCGFDEKLPGYRKRNLDKEKDVDYLEMMKAVVEGKQAD